MIQFTKYRLSNEQKQRKTSGAVIREKYILQQKHGIQDKSSILVIFVLFLNKLIYL